MALVGRGKIAVWEGGALWLLRGVQPSADLAEHAHHAIQVTFALAGQFELGCGDLRCPGPIAAVAADVPHTFQATGVSAFLFAEPESTAGRALARLVFADGPMTEVCGEPFTDALGQLRRFLDAEPEPEDLTRIGRTVLEALPAPDSTALPDLRARSMIEFAQAGLDGPITLTAAARHARLSNDRARHLFVEHTGLPFKAYVRWLRLQRAVSLYAGGATLTEAAHEAGFSDSAHLSRTFRRTFGLPAAALRLL